MKKETIYLTEEELEDFDFTGGNKWELRGEIYNFVEQIDIPNGDDGEIWEIVVQRKSDDKYFKWDCWRTSYEYYMSDGDNYMEEVFPKTVNKVVYI